MAQPKRYYWLKLRTDFFDDRRIKKLRRLAGGDTFTIIYLKMQLRAVNNDGKIFYEGLEDSFEDEIALELDEDPDNVKVTVSFLKSVGLLEESAGGDALVIPNADSLIGSESASAQRVRAHRHQMRLLQCNASVTECNTEKEIDIEIDIEKEREKEIEIEREEKRVFPPPSSLPFSGPTGREVREFVTEKHLQVDPDDFLDYYDRRGWKDGSGRPIQDWKSLIRKWGANNDG